jgi:hypothetical protein
MPEQAIIKPIPTKYKGVQFRSRLEAKWAVFFDGIQFPWRYEEMPYRMTNGSKYYPDFTSVLEFAIEIKPIVPNQDYRNKLLDSSMAQQEPILLLCGYPRVLRETRKFPSLGYYYSGDGNEEALWFVNECGSGCPGWIVQTQTAIILIGEHICESTWWFPTLRLSEEWLNAIDASEHYRFDLS